MCNWSLDSYFNADVICKECDKQEITIKLTLGFEGHVLKSFVVKCEHGEWEYNEDNTPSIFGKWNDDDQGECGRHPFEQWMDYIWTS